MYKKKKIVFKTNYLMLYFILDIFTVKRRLRDLRREMGKSAEAAETESGLMGRSGKVVITAVAM